MSDFLFLFFSFFLCFLFDFFLCFIFFFLLLFFSCLLVLSQFWKRKIYQVDGERCLASSPELTLAFGHFTSFHVCFVCVCACLWLFGASVRPCICLCLILFVFVCVFVFEFLPVCILYLFACSNLCLSLFTCLSF